MSKITSNNKNLFLLFLSLVCATEKSYSNSDYDNSESETDGGVEQSSIDGSEPYSSEDEGTPEVWSSYFGNLRKGIGDSAGWLKAKTWDNLPSSNSLRDSAGWLKDVATSAGGTLYNALGHVGQGIGDSAGWVKNIWAKTPSWSSFYGGAQKGENDANLVDRNVGLNEEDLEFLLNKVLQKRGRGTISPLEREEIWGKLKQIAEEKCRYTRDLAKRIDEIEKSGKKIEPMRDFTRSYLLR